MRINTALHFASALGDGGLVQLLLDHDADVNAEAGGMATKLPAEGEERLKKARILFTHAFESYKKIYDDEKAASRTTAAPSQPPRTETMTSLLDDGCMVDSDDDNSAPSGAISELDQFFAAFRIYGRGDRRRPFLWWKEFGHHFPVVSQMAREFLAIPGTSVSVERLFSKSRHLCHEARGSMKAETIMKAMLTKMWIRAGYLDY
ncbi:ribonuclease H-like domain-containing protein [Mycena olivaceomarginata]|nr:ribonuclease H-like domain-containing protein [Mycena olivaceomarginata]